MNPALITLAIQETPAIIAMLQGLFAQKNPGTTPPTSEEVIAAYEAAFASSVAKDEKWLQSHPEK